MSENQQAQIHNVEFDQGEVIPPVFYSMYHWTPQLGALLVSGIFPYEAGRNNERTPRTYFHSDMFFELNFYDFLEPLRLNNAKYMCNLWIEQRGNSLNTSITPEQYLHWYSKIPPQNVGFDGKALKYNGSITLVGGSSRIVKTTDSRDNSLNALITKACKTAVQPITYQTVWAELVKMAISKNPPAPFFGFVDEEGIQYMSESGAKIFTKKALRSRFSRREKSKVAPQ